MKPEGSDGNNKEREGVGEGREWPLQSCDAPPPLVIGSTGQKQPSHPKPSHCFSWAPRRIEWHLGIDSLCDSNVKSGVMEYLCVGSSSFEDKNPQSRAWVRRDPANRTYDTHLYKVTVLVRPNLHVLIGLWLNKKSHFSEEPTAHEGICSPSSLWGSTLICVLSLTRPNSD